MKKTAILYARWSSLEQGKGSSLQRQTELGEAFCAAKDWQVSEHLCDQGLSAYTGENLRTGELGKLTERLERDGGEGVVIVVEKLDRLSRQPPLIMTNWLQRVCATGATIATADGRHVIDQGALMTNPMGIMAIIYEAFVGYEESKKKSDRGLENWDIKRRSGAPLTKLCPAWMKLNNDRLAYELIPERAALVRRIFELQDSGVGKHTIAAMLNAEGVAPWGRGMRWHASYIQKIVRNIAAVGDHRHGRKQRGAKSRTMCDDVVKGYFPAVVDEALFARVNDRRHQRVIGEQRNGTIANLFTKLARCSCGSIMTFRNKGTSKRADGSVAREEYLVCDAAIRPGAKGGCSHRTSYPYARFRDVVLDQLLHRALDDQFFRAPDSLSGLEADVAARARDMANVERRMRVAWAMVEEDVEDAYARTRYRTLKAELGAAQAALGEAQGELELAKGSVSPADHLVRVDEVRGMMDSDDVDVRNEARAMVKLALNDVIKTCVFDASKERAMIGMVADIGVLFVRRDGTSSWFDLAKDGRDYTSLSADDQATVAGYLRRSAT